MRTIELNLDHPMTPHIAGFFMVGLGEPIIVRLGEVYAIVTDGQNPAADVAMKVGKQRNQEKPTSWEADLALVSRFLDRNATAPELIPFLTSPALMNRYFGNSSFLRFAAKMRPGFPTHMKSERNGATIVHTFSFYGNPLAYRMEKTLARYVSIFHPGKPGILGITSGNLSGQSVAVAKEASIQLSQDTGFRLVIHRDAPQTGASYPVIEMIDRPIIYRERGDEGKHLVAELDQILLNIAAQALV